MCYYKRGIPAQGGQKRFCHPTLSVTQQYVFQQNYQLLNQRKHEEP